MTGFDWILALLIAGLTAWGLVSGFVYSLGSLLGTILGIVVATRLYEPLGDEIAPVLFGQTGVARAVAFFLLFLVVNQAVGAAFWVIGKAVGIMSIIPGFAILNRVAGAVLGFIAGIIILGVVFGYGQSIMENDSFSGTVDSSVIAPFFLRGAELVMWAAPHGMTFIRTVTDTP